MTAHAIFIPEPFPEDALAVVPSCYSLRQGRVGKAYTEEELSAEVAEVSALAVTSRDFITKRVIESAPNLRVIGKSGAKPSNVDFKAAEQRDIRIIWTPSANAVSVAEMTVGMILHLVRRFNQVNDVVVKGGWRSYSILGREVASLTVGIVGLGAVGLKVARLLGAFGAKLAGTDPHVSTSVACHHGVRLMEFKDLCRISDVVTLHCELNERTEGLVGTEAFRIMKDGAFLVNTARGGLVDEDALLKAIESGRLRGAALDVFTQEPPDGDAALLRHPNVFCSPHVAAYTEEAIYRETSWILEDIVNVLQGRTLAHQV